MHLHRVITDRHAATNEGRVPMPTNRSHYEHDDAPATSSGPMWTRKIRLGLTAHH